MRIINLTSHSRRGLAKCNGGKLLIRRPGSRAGGIRRAFKSSGFFVFSEVRTLENPTIPLLLCLFQIKEIPAVLLTFTFSCQLVVRTRTWSRPFQYRSISKGCHTHMFPGRSYQQLVWRNPTPVAVTPKIYSPSFSSSLSSSCASSSSSFLSLPSLSYHPYAASPRETAAEHITLLCVCFGGFARKVFKNLRGHKELMERVWEARRNSIRHSGRIRHLELLLTHTNVLLQSTLKNIWIWFENNPYIASSTYVRQIYITWVMCNCVCVCGDGGE